MKAPLWATQMARTLAIGKSVPLARLARACGVVPEAFRKRASEMGAVRQTGVTRWGVWVVSEKRAAKILTEYRRWR